MRRPDPPRLPPGRRAGPARPGARRSLLGCTGRGRRRVAAARRRRASCCSPTARRRSTRRSTPSPDAPAEVRGEMGSIADARARRCASARGCRGSAAVMDRVTVVRSMTHPYPVHGVAYAVSGIPDLHARPGDAAPRRAALAVHRLGRRLPRGRATGGRHAAGPAQHRPAVDAQLEDRPARQRRPLRRVPRPGARPGLDRLRRQGHRAPSRSTPTARRRSSSTRSAAATPDGRFVLSADARPPADVPADRLDARRSLLRQFDRARRSSTGEPATAPFDRHQRPGLLAAHLAAGCGTPSTSAASRSPSASATA